MESLKYTRCECKYHTVFIPEIPEESFVCCLTPTNGECVEQMKPESAVPPSVPDKTILTVVGLMFALSVMTYFVRTILSIAGPSIIKEFQLSETEMGAIYSAFLFTYALLMLPVGT